MKRTELKRKTPLQARTPIERKSALNARQPQKAQKPRRKPAQKDCRWRSPAYLAFVRSLPCVLCSATPCDPHHVIGLGWGLSGMGLTAPDSFVMPACRRCHGEIHADHTLHHLQPHWIKRTIRAALSDDVSTEARDELVHALAFIEAREAL